MGCILDHSTNDDAESIPQQEVRVGRSYRLASGRSGAAARSSRRAAAQQHERCGGASGVLGDRSETLNAQAHLPPSMPVPPLTIRESYETGMNFFHVEAVRCSALLGQGITKYERKPVHDTSLNVLAHHQWLLISSEVCP